METEDPWGPRDGEELVPTVDPADMHAAWQLYRDAGLRNPTQQVAIGLNVFKHFCSPGAEIGSVTYRTVFLMMLFERVHIFLNEAQAQRLLEWQHGDTLDDRLAEVMARIPLKWLSKEGIHSSLPFDVDDFIKQVQKAA
jgi:hypothetical protein